MIRVVSQDSCIQILHDDEKIAVLQLPEARGATPLPIRVEPCEDKWFHIRIGWNLERPIPRDEWSLRFDLAFTPDFYWAPHLSPDEGYVIAQHVFRAPAAIASDSHRTFVVVPDLDTIGHDRSTPAFLDLDATRNCFWFGLSRTRLAAHVLFEKTSGMELPGGCLELAFFLNASGNSVDIADPWNRVSQFLWNRWGSSRLASGEPLTIPMDCYVDHAYRWAFETWRSAVWQEFELEGTPVGAPQFVVNISQSPNFPGVWEQREYLSIWNQAWFSSLRSASGLFRYARRTGNAELGRYARLTRDLALNAPLHDGIFPAVIRTENLEVDEGGKVIQRPRGWEHAFWANSDRVPWEHGITPQWYHLLDSSWTALQMLQWFTELEPDPRLLDFAKTYGDRLLTLQDADGFFPGWLHPDTREPGPVMNQTPETSGSALFLFKLAAVTSESSYQTAALKAIEAVLHHIVPEGRWEDFETFWSCCPWGKETVLGRKIPRNAMHKQNTLSMFWTSEALLEAWRATRQSRYLEIGLRTLHELSMAQQVWRPPYIHVPALGGFGVMNADGEWNDARQSLFAELFMQYYRETGDSILFERGVAALKSSFIMMYCPENTITRQQWETVYPWLGPEDYGFMMENYGHGGETSPEGEGVGFFTIYDWGPGSAAEARNRIHDHFGDVYIDRIRNHAFGIDSVEVKRMEEGWQLVDQAQSPRDIRVVFEDGTDRTIHLETRVLVS